MPITSGTQQKGELVVMEAHQTAVGIDIDCYNGYVYWTDVAQAKIKRSRYNGSNVEVFLHEGNIFELIKYVRYLHCGYINFLYLKFNK